MSAPPVDDARGVVLNTTRDSVLTTARALGIDQFDGGGVLSALGSAGGCVLAYHALRRSRFHVLMLLRRRRLLDLAVQRSGQRDPLGSVDRVALRMLVRLATARPLEGILLLASEISYLASQLERVDQERVDQAGVRRLGRGSPAAHGGCTVRRLHIWSTPLPNGQRRGGILLGSEGFVRGGFVRGGILIGNGRRRRCAATTRDERSDRERKKHAHDEARREQCETHCVKRQQGRVGCDWRRRRF